jgi:hypothetical protein
MRGLCANSASICAIETPCFLAFGPVAIIPIESADPQTHHSAKLDKCIYIRSFLGEGFTTRGLGRQQQNIWPNGRSGGRVGTKSTNAGEKSWPSAFAKSGPSHEKAIGQVSTRSRTRNEKKCPTGLCRHLMPKQGILRSRVRSRMRRRTALLFGGTKAAERLFSVARKNLTNDLRRVPDYAAGPEVPKCRFVPR